MIETLEGLKNAEGIAKVPGVTAGLCGQRRPRQLSQVSARARPDYERANQHRARRRTQSARPAVAVRLHGATRPDFTCFPGGKWKPAAINRGGGSRTWSRLPTRSQKPEVGPYATAPAESRNQEGFRRHRNGATVHRFSTVSSFGDLEEIPILPLDVYELQFATTTAS